MGYKYSRGRREGRANPFLGFAAKSCGSEALGGETVHSVSAAKPLVPGLTPKQVGTLGCAVPEA